MEGRGTSRMAKRKAPQVKPPLDSESEAWNNIPWHKLEQHCFRIQKRIFRASQRGNSRAVHKLQKLLMKSQAARLLAVRRVTQDNQGKKTAGIGSILPNSPLNQNGKPVLNPIVTGSVQGVHALMPSKLSSKRSSKRTNTS